MVSKRQTHDSYCFCGDAVEEPDVLFISREGSVCARQDGALVHARGSLRLVRPANTSAENLLGWSLAKEDEKPEVGDGFAQSSVRRECCKYPE